MKTGNKPTIEYTTIYENGFTPKKSSNPFDSRTERRKRHEASTSRISHGLNKRERRELRKRINTIRD